MSDDHFLHLPQPWQACIEQFLLSVKDRTGSEASYVTYRSYLVCFFRFCNKRPEDITKTDVLRFVQSPANAPRNRGGEASASTKNVRRSVLTGLFNAASEYQVDEGVPLWSKALPTRGLHDLKTRVAYRAMSDQDLAAFFQALPPDDTPRGARDRALFMTLLYTAKRKSEISRLKWMDIEESTIREKSGISRQGRVFHYTSKGHSREIKTAELPMPAWKAIERYLRVSSRLDTIRGDDYVFISTRVVKSRPKNTPLDPDYVNQIYKYTCLKAKLDPSFTTHSLRHTSAKNRLQAGQDLFDLKDILGHESIETTWRYARSIQGVADSASLSLESRFAFLTR